MSRYNTGNPVPSTAVKDFSDNTQITDELINLKKESTPNRLGESLLTWFGIQAKFSRQMADFEIYFKNLMATMGYTPVDSFQEGATLQYINQVLHWKLPDGDGDYYRWNGDFPKVVPPGSTPATSGGVGDGAWKNIGDALLRSQLASASGASMIGLANGNVAQAITYITPEMFMNGSQTVTVDVIKRCADYAKISGLPVVANGVYALTDNITLDSISWVGGMFTGSSTITIFATELHLENAKINGPVLQMIGGDCRISNNTFYNQTSTAAFLIKALTKPGSILCTSNEFYNCNYAILQQGTGEPVLYGRYSGNNIHDIHGDGIELNVVNNHYVNGLIIEDNIISNVNGTDTFWGIGIGVAGKGPYGVDAADSQYVANFTIRGNRISGCRQCIHTELCRDFTIEGNECYPDTSKSTNSGLYFAAFASYGCKNFTVDGLSGEPVGTAKRFILIDWGVNSGQYAGPPRDFTVRNINTLNGDIEITTAGANDWSNTTVLENIRCNKLKWRGLPASSVFRNIFTKNIDCIGQHAYGEGSGGGIYTRSHYTYTNWSNVVCLTDVYQYVSISKMYIDRIDESGNNFYVVTDSESAGRRGPTLFNVNEQYQLADDNFPGGREFAKGTVLWKLSGGYFLVTAAGAYIRDSGTYADKIKATNVGQTFIQSNMLNWASGYGTKSSGTDIIIPGAGVAGGDLKAKIIRATYVKNDSYTVDIDTPIVTATPENTIIRAAKPVSYIEK